MRRVFNSLPIIIEFTRVFLSLPWRFPFIKYAGGKCPLFCGRKSAEITSRAMLFAWSLRHFATAFDYNLVIRSLYLLPTSRTDKRSFAAPRKSSHLASPFFMDPQTGGARTGRRGRKTTVSVRGEKLKLLKTCSVASEIECKTRSRQASLIHPEIADVLIKPVAYCGMLICCGAASSVAALAVARGGGAGTERKNFFPFRRFRSSFDPIFGSTIRGGNNGWRCLKIIASKLMESCKTIV